MKYKDILGLSFDDACMYYSETIALPIGKGEVASAISITNKRGEGRHVDMSDADIPETDTRFLVLRHEDQTLWTPEEFFKEYKVVRSPLGWRNYGNTAIYLYTQADRGNKKGYVNNAIRIISPYALALQKYINKEFYELRQALNKASSKDGADKLIKKYEKEMFNCKRFVSRFSEANSLAGLNKVLAPETHEFLSIDGAINLLCDHSKLTKTGAALHPSIGVVITEHSPENGATLFFHSSPVGVLTRRGWSVKPAHKDIEPQLVRHLGATL